MKARLSHRIARVLAGLIAGAATMLVTASAYAQAAAEGGFNDRDKYVALAAGIGLGVAALGGALGQGRAAAAALDGIARNPSASDKLFTPMILGLALIESLVIYSLVISILLYTKIH
jgi:F-type H+-transporting ATPase subunit c